MIIKYLIGLIVGWIIGSIGIINIITILRFGIPRCNRFIRNKTEYLNKVKKLRTTYVISLSVWIIIVVFITIICYKFLENGFIGYIVSIIISLILGFKQTGDNLNNVSDFMKMLDKET